MIRKPFLSRKRAIKVAFLTLLGSVSAWVLYAGEPVTLLQAPRQESISPSASAPGERPIRIDRAPLRTLEEDISYSAFNAVAVDPMRDEIVLQSGNHPRILVYDRLDSSTPKRVIEGPKTKSGNAAVYVDPMNGDIYSVATDRRDTMVVHSRTAEGDVAPVRELNIPHRGFGVGVDEEAQEVFLTSQSPPAVIVYSKTAKGNDAPLRILEGARTQLADLQGIALDTENHLMYVANRGDGSRLIEGEGYSAIPTILTVGGVRTWNPPRSREPNYARASGSFTSPSITVHPLSASGNTPPLRVIQGPQTRLKWPGFIYLDTRHQELFVADSFDDSILVFRATDSGDVSPIRVLKGSRTGLKNPYGVVVDEKNEELLVANYGNYTATVYPRTAVGDAPPIRTFRGAPEGTLVPIFQHVASMAYDTKRDEVLASSCIIHPQIAAFAKAETGEMPTRIISGPAAGVGRAMHDMRYDEVHDEIVTVTPFPQAILTFRGGADGEEPPLRIIQGSRTQMREPDIVVVDPVHEEIFVAELNGTILVFPRTANGNVAPIRVLTVPDVGHLEKIPLAVDPINDLLAVGRRGPNNQGQILIFNRTDQGNVEPKAVIAGPKTGLRNSPNVVAYPARGWLLAGVGGGVGVWSVQDSGDVPPRFLLGGPSGGGSGNIILNPKAKEVIVGGGLSLRTYYFPEIF